MSQNLYSTRFHTDQPKRHKYKKNINDNEEYICMYMTCKHICTYDIYVIYIFISMYKHKYTFSYLHIHICVYRKKYVCIHIHIYIYAKAYMCTHMYTYMYTYMSIYIFEHFFYIKIHRCIEK
jgi:hypothetical protein